MDIIKRDGSIVEFNIDKIQSAIKKANREVSSEKEDMSNNDIIGLAEQVSHIIQALEDKEVDVETIQNIVEEVLMYNGYYNTAKRYILYRKEREENRLHGWQMSELQKDIYNQKYRKGSENFDDFLNRVTDGNGIIKKAMRDKKFMPAGRILAGRGLEKEGKKITFSNCFVKGTPVLTRDGYKSIEEVQIDELVITGENRWRPTVNTLRKKYSGDMYEISTRATKPVIATSEHPFFTQRGWVEAKDLTNSDYIKVGRLDMNNIVQPIITFDMVDFITLADNEEIIYRENDTIAIGTTFIGGNGAQVSKTGTYSNRFVELNEDLAYVFGLWLGDGSITKRKGKERYSIFQIVGNISEQHQLIKAKIILEEAFGCEFNLSYNKEQNTTILRKDSAIISEFFLHLFGAGAKSKRVPSFLKHSLPLALGVLDSDGLITLEQSVRLSLSNELLLEDVKQILNTNGFPTLKTFFSGRNGFDLWTFNIPHYISRELIELMSKKYSDGRHIIEGELDEYSSKVIKGEKYLKISKIVTYNLAAIGAEIDVYNLSVREDESYVVNGLVTHNCYVMPQVEDNIESIFDTAKYLARTFSYGGGVGLNISKLRPRGASVNNAAGTTTGAVSFMDLYSLVTGLIGQSGRRGR